MTATIEAPVDTDRYKVVKMHGGGDGQFNRGSEQTLNDLAAEGWRVIAATGWAVILERAD